jgi:F0F1-type ATP synthase membrane subunit b/b'
MKDPDPRALELMEKFIRDRHARIGDARHKAYRKVADALEAAQHREKETRLAFERATKALVAAQREMDDFWAQWEHEARNELKPPWTEELAELLRGLRALKSD